MSLRPETISLKEAVATAVEATREAPADERGALAAEVLRFLLAVRPSGVYPQEVPDVRTGARALGQPSLHATLGEQLADLGNVSHPERIVAIVAYRFQREGIEGLTADEILAAYRDARLPRPGNLSEYIARAIRRGWLAEASPRDGRKAWRVTSSGLNEWRRWLAPSLMGTETEVESER